MKIVKLNAIHSTNTFLKDLARESILENYTVVVTESQTKGKGQIENKWHSEVGKNLTFSVLCRFLDFDIANAFYLNCAISLAIYTVLKDIVPTKLAVKWPNDILSFQKKICGILIENTVSNGKISHSIIGVGLNVNQERFSKELPNATSLKIITHQNFDKDKLLKQLVTEIKRQITILSNKEFSVLKEAYHNVLYRKNVPAMFSNSEHKKFMGKILGITHQGKLIVELENEQLETFDLKEIRFI